MAERGAGQLPFADFRQQAVVHRREFVRSIVDAPVPWTPWSTGVCGRLLTGAWMPLLNVVPSPEKVGAVDGEGVSMSGGASSGGVADGGAGATGGLGASSIGCSRSAWR